MLFTHSTSITISYRFNTSRYFRSYFRHILVLYRLQS
jgi:hypothetical protein